MGICKELLNDVENMTGNIAKRYGLESDTTLNFYKYAKRYVIKNTKRVSAYYSYLMGDNYAGSWYYRILTDR